MILQGIPCGSSFHNSSWIVTKKGIARSNPNGCFRSSLAFHQIPSQILLKSKKFQCRERFESKLPDFRLSCCFYDNNQVSADDQSDANHVDDESMVLKKKSEEVAAELSGQNIYLVGMMGSGKTTVGKILAEMLGYSFVDSDKLVEQASGASSVAQIFEEKGEDFFRNKESEVLKSLSCMSRLVVATGGGAVIEEKNWDYMKKGITVWLDVPLETLGKRVAAVGTDSRPLLNRKSGDTYRNALEGFLEIFKNRGGMYAKANTRVCLENIASKLDLKDVSDLTPTAIAIEALIQIDKLLKER